jgi:two-component system phosphate regulon response regulator PhoB
MDDTVLLVEDETDVVDLLRYHFKKAGFKVEMANSGDAGLAAVRSKRPDAVVLDLMLPGMTGLEVCRALKADNETSAIPVLMLTARGEVKDRVKGLEIGADDYVTKPFSPKEVVLRVQGLLRRIRSAAEEVNLLEVDGISIDKTALKASVDDQRLDLTTIEFKLLLTLVTNRGRILSRETLLSNVWGYSSSADTRTVDTHMRRLREKLGDHAEKVETIRGQGYRFSAPHTHSS